MGCAIETWRRRQDSKTQVPLKHSVPPDSFLFLSCLAPTQVQWRWHRSPFLVDWIDKTGQADEARTIPRRILNPLAVSGQRESLIVQPCTTLDTNVTLRILPIRFTLSRWTFKLFSLISPAASPSGQPSSSESSSSQASASRAEESATNRLAIWPRSPAKRLNRVLLLHLSLSTRHPLTRKTTA